MFNSINMSHVFVLDQDEALDFYTNIWATGFTFGLTTDDCRKTYETLEERGVEFAEEPTEQPYGIDCGARDPFGNHFRIVQPAPRP